jgi:hypothetical protein
MSKPVGPVRAPQSLHARVVFFSLTMITHLPADWPLYSSCVFEQTPTRIQTDFRHPGLHELGTTDIAHDDRLILTDNFPREFVQSVFATPSRPPVQPLYLTLVPPALCLGDFLLDLAVEPACLELLSVAGRHRGFQAQVEPDAVLGCGDGDHLIGDRQA